LFVQTKAVEMLLSISINDVHHSSALSLAADAVGSASDPRLTLYFTNYLLGDYDGVPKVTLPPVSLDYRMIGSTVFVYPETSYLVASQVSSLLIKPAGTIAGSCGSEYFK